MKSKKKFNWKARQSAENDDTKEKVADVSIELDIQDDKYDSSNAFLLPPKKSSEKKKASKKEIAKKQSAKLSRKQKKKLQKVLERKQKKVNRAEILEELQKNQVTQEELSLMVSTSAMQTKGLKRFSIGDANEKPKGRQRTEVSLNSIKGSKPPRPKLPKIEGDNVLGFTESESSTSDEETDEGDKNSEVIEQPNEHKDEATPESSYASSADISSQVDPGNPQSELIKPTVSAQENEMPEKVTEKVLKKSVFIPVNRLPEVQEARLLLPILPEEQVIMETINENNIILICGETGSGKTTQIPQFLYEAGYASGKGMIGITEPRRVAAVSMSKRVAYEMSLSSDIVSYQIRFEGNTTENTKIKFMTDGVLLKEVQNDFLLRKYNVVIIDEAHERSIYSDILIGLLSRIVPLRQKRGNPLKLIIMSATLRIEDFTQNTYLFKVSPPIIQVSARQFPVSIHFNKRTPDSYMHEVFRKVCKIHNQLPAGGILVFVTGQQEVLSLCKKLRQRFPFNDQMLKQQINDSPSDHKNDSEDDSDDDREFRRKRKKKVKAKVDKKEDININLDNYSVTPLDEGELESLVDEDREFNNLSDSDEEEDVKVSMKNNQPLYVLPLFSLLPPPQQARVFQPPPAGVRLCVVATNVAETSLTIPNIRYVVDTGKVKTRVYDKVTGVSAFVISWISKASADQRAGRAGRTGPGHCYRLYSSSVFNDEFSKYTPAEITRRPVEDLVLQMKAMYIEKVVNFPYPSPPDKEALKAAEKKLILMGALEEPPKPTRFIEIKKWEWSSKITPLGRAMSCFPVSPRYAKMLALSHQHNLLPYVITIVSCLTVQEVFTNNEFMERIKSAGGSLALGDFMVLLKAIGSAEYVGITPNLCEKHGLRYKALSEIRKLRTQLTNEMNLLVPDLNLYVDPKMEPPTDLQLKLLRQIMLMGFSDHIAKRITEDELSAENLPETVKHAYKSVEVEQPVYIHPRSVLFKENPLYVMYQEIFETSKLFMRVVAEVDIEWLPIYAPKQCSFSPPLEEPPPRYNLEKDKIVCHVTSTFGPHSWPIPSVEVEFPSGLDRFRWFAKFLLEGQVIEFFNKYAGVLMLSPATMVKSWSKLHPKTERFLQALMSQNVDSRQHLIEVWNSNARFLLQEYKEWVPESVQYEVEVKWPPECD